MGFKELLKYHISLGKKRFTCSKEDEYDQIIIFDVLNTEPVCVIYSKYHPYAKDVILKALEDFEAKNKDIERTLKFLNGVDQLNIEEVKLRTKE